MKASTKLFLVSAGSLLGIGLIVFMGLFPVLSKVSNLHQEVLAKKTEALNLEAQIAAYQAARTDLASALKREEITGNFVERENLAAVIKKLEQAAVDAGIEQTLTIVDENVGQATAQSQQVAGGEIGIEEVPYSLDVKATYQSLIDFLKYLEHLPHFTEITKINVYSATASSGREQIPVHSGRILGTIDSVFFVKKHAGPAN
jgi:hypothetical protein